MCCAPCFSQNESLSSTLHETKRAFIREQEAKAREFDERDKARQAHIMELEKNLKVPARPAPRARGALLGVSLKFSA